MPICFLLKTFISHETCNSMTFYFLKDEEKEEKEEKKEKKKPLTHKEKKELVKKKRLQDEMDRCPRWFEFIHKD